MIAEFVARWWPFLAVFALIVTLLLVEVITGSKLTRRVDLRYVGNRETATRVVVVFPGAFMASGNSTQFQFEPLAAELGLAEPPPDTLVVYVESSGSTYDRDLVVEVAEHELQKLLEHESRPSHVTFIGTSMGAGVAWEVAVGLSYDYLTVVDTAFIAVDGVGDPGDLVQPTWAVRAIGETPFGYLSNLLPVARVMIQPSGSSPDPKWAGHMLDGLEMARSTPTAVWGGQMLAMGNTRVTLGSLTWCSEVLLVTSSLDKSVVDAEHAWATWRDAGGSAFNHTTVIAEHSAYEDVPRGYAAAMRPVVWRH